MTTNEHVPLSKPYVPDLDKYTGYLKDIWRRRWLTNQGPLLERLEAELAPICGGHVVVMTNGTLAIEILLQAALQQTKIESATAGPRATAAPSRLPSGERPKILTTPYSYIATSTSITRMGFDAEFVDIDREHFMPDVALLPENPRERGIVALLFTQIYGAPGPWREYQAYADRHGLPLLYDGSHSFANTLVVGSASLAESAVQPLTSLGLASTLSFHATKVFGTCEGGAVVTRDAELAERCRILRSFGVWGGQFLAEGTNAKMSELHAAFGLCALQDLPSTIAGRRQAFEAYRAHLPRSLRLMDASQELELANYCYAIVVMPSEAQVLASMAALLAAGVASRRYFHPSLDTYYAAPPMPVSHEISGRVLCLPLFSDLSQECVVKICSILKSVL